MPGSGNATWNAGDSITATKLNNIETALTASAAKAGDTFTAAVTFQTTLGGSLKDPVIITATDGKTYRVRINTDNSLEIRNSTDSITLLKMAADGSTLTTNGNKIWTQANDGTGSGLDADLIDGLNAGNASGNVPISNGTRNVNLNADLLDGLDSTAFLQLSGGTMSGNLNGGNAFFTALVGAGSGLSLDHTALNGEVVDSLLIYGVSPGGGTGAADTHYKNQTGGWQYFDMKNASAHFDANAVLSAAGIILGPTNVQAISIFSGTGAGTFNHGLGRTPLFVAITDSQASSTMTVGADSYGPTTVHINTGASHTWVGIAIG